jgi:hypothetical protein
LLENLSQEKIEKHHQYHGDHILEWGKGGKTILSNCNVLHKRCHEMK